MAGGTGSDIYYVNATGDIVTEAVGAGTDTVFSYLGAYTLGSNVENGRIMSTSAANLTGNALNNTLFAGVGNNILQGGGGIDTVSYAYGVSGTVGVTVNLGVTTAQATGGSGSDTFGSIENLTGSANADRITGNSGNNVLMGAAGNDTLSGGAGNDNLLGDTGKDSMTGGAGSDKFTFNTTLGPSNVDIITDFVHGTDKIVLDDDIFTKIGAPGTLLAGAFRKGAGVTTAGDADDRIILNTTTGALYYDANGNAAGAAVQFATLTGTSTKTTITASDFLVVA
jgi:Ca2+-binding RTX toxin-like protein